PIEEITAGLPEALRTGHNVPESFVARHPYLLEDGSIVSHTGMGPLFRIDKDSRLVWTWDTLSPAHHAIERDHEGNLIVVGDTADTPINEKPDEIVSNVSARTPPDGLGRNGRSTSSRPHHRYPGPERL
ncbi:MAG: hypothetical protein ACIALR_08285, partial [Blastopirellula sp. JB062]